MITLQKQTTFFKLLLAWCCLQFVGCTTDDIPPAVSLSIESLILSEEDGPVEITATLNSASDADVVVPLVFSGNAVLGGDFEVSSESILIASGETQGSVSLTELPDGPTEGTKTIRISVGEVQGAIVLSSISFEVLILDVDSGFNFVAEKFDLAPGTPLVGNGWFSHSGGNTNPIVTSDAPLSWQGYVGSGVGTAALVTNNGQNINRPFPTDIVEGTAYASFLMKVNAPFPESGSGVFFHYGYYTNVNPNQEYSNLANAFRARTHVAQGDSADSFKLGLTFNAANPIDLTGNYTIGETLLVVVKYEFFEGDGTDEVSLFVFNEGADISEEPTEPTLGPFTRTGTAGDAPALQAIALRQFNANQDVTVDGIYVRNEWNLTSEW